MTSLRKDVKDRKGMMKPKANRNPDDGAFGTMSGSRQAAEQLRLGSEIESQKSEIGSRKSEIGNRKSEVGNWKLKSRTGNGQGSTVNRQPTTGRCFASLACPDKTDNRQQITDHQCTINCPCWIFLPISSTTTYEYTPEVQVPR